MSMTTIDIISIAFGIAGFVSAICTIIVHMRSIKKTGRKESIKNWRINIERMIKNDNQRLNEHARLLEIADEHDRVILRSIKGILLHLARGNDTGTMEDLIKGIDDHLITR